MLYLRVSSERNRHTRRKGKGGDATTGQRANVSLAGNPTSITIPTKGHPAPNPTNLKSGLMEENKMNEILWQMAYESDFRKACEILGYDPENLTEEQQLEIAEYLMTAEEL